MQKFNPELFNQVLESNLQVFINHVKIQAEKQVIKVGSALISEEDTRQLAVDFFNVQLSQYLTSRLINKI